MQRKTVSIFCIICLLVIGLSAPVSATTWDKKKKAHLMSYWKTILHEMCIFMTNRVLDKVTFIPIKVDYIHLRDFKSL